MKIFDAAFTNALGHTPEEGGVCNPCHVVHNAVSEQFLWAGPLGNSSYEGWNSEYATDDSFMIKLCTGCHSEENSAGSKVPKHGLHPSGLALVKESKNPLYEQFPLYTSSGELSPEGNIVCSTCHNPHQWDSSVSGKGSGRDSEGSAKNSFLRSEVPQRLCATCHGEEGLFKFLYFHSTTGRAKEDPFFNLQRKR
jgi:hypothetical protein